MIRRACDQHVLNVEYRELERRRIRKLRILSERRVIYGEKIRSIKTRAMTHGQTNRCQEPVRPNHSRPSAFEQDPRCPGGPAQARCPGHPHRMSQSTVVDREGQATASLGPCGDVSSAEQTGRATPWTRSYSAHCAVLRTHSPLYPLERSAPRE